MTLLHKHWKTILRIAITVGGLALVLRQVPFQLILSEYAGAAVSWLVVALVLMMLSLVVRAYRWLLLMRGVGADIQFGRLISLYFVGNFFNSFLPSGFGGDVVRIVEAAQDVPASVAAGTVIVDRLTGLMMLFVLAIAVLPFRPDTFPTSLTVIILIVSVGGLLASLLLLQVTWISRMLTWLQQYDVRFVNIAIDRFFNPLLSAIKRCGWQAVAGALGVSFIFNLMLVGWWYAAGRALGYNIAFSYYFLVIPILSIAMLVPSIGGLGVREVLAPILFSGAGLEPESAYALSLLVWILMRLSSLAGVPVYIVSALRRDPTAKSVILTEVNHE
jgi:uncharacterized protein (TIRG00374 family)